ncbi:unconventional myosin-XVIIIa isoform X3 [Maniola jurtina]|uniref:unconventional myosin-XVIIIa isoform X3 n=1 Tax=Maniola jurtina TaxID=191418 RepID=UPI001E68CE2A|nr:unconventional myosin-XVIIIa isoform X3 [Maniola jurtina]XP_045770485.1 unconventional myosin-XVIIIa isoform X3 [Maniola jurtina]XP_045770486.1 unconventional myosin-XVIIIa isoform X3 [Maniola jurtina]XP_045770487.1 unconventional myosin-XVIIIa isoform X3 [Maniola jurtina]
MFHIQGTFEQSLRCGDELSPNGNKTLAALAKIHKHCTGKSHAHGCVDSKNPLAKSDSNTSLQSKKSFRSDCYIEIKEATKNDSNITNKNGSMTKSFSNSTSSYEGHSDTDSETAFKPRVEPKLTDPCERLFAQNTKASLMKTARMRYADDSATSPVNDEIDGEKWKNNFVRTSSRGSFRDRKSGVVTIEEVKSDGLSSHEDDKKRALTPNKNIVCRKNSSGTVNGKPGSNGTKPPWRSASKNGISNEPFVRSPSLRGSIRKKKFDGVPWRRLYDLSLWRKYGVNFALNGADSERALLRPWSELSSQPQPLYEAKSEEQLACEKEWLQAGHMWLAHRGGFTAVVREGDADAGRAKVRVLQTGEVITVDEDDLEKANPPQLERCEDIASLRCLNECGALHVLRSRFAAALPHARAGHALLVLGPPRRTTPVYTEKVAAMFRGCRVDDMPPHVFAAAQSAHRCMLASRRDRAIVFLGRSGSGKTSAMRHSVWYLASAYPAQGSKLTPERLDAALDVLHAFGSSRTGSNPHASRFVSLTSLDFDGGGALVSASVQILLPDLKPDQTALRALHTLFHGCDGRLRRELLLDQAPINSPNLYVGSTEKADAPAEFSALKDALQHLAVTEQEQMAIWKILAAICHLGWAGVVRANTGSGLKYQFANGGCASRAARLLGVGAEEIARAIFTPPTPPSPQPNTAPRTPSPSNEKEAPGSEALDAFVAGLYNETFNIVAALVNRSLSTSARTSASILLLDTPGADNPMCAGQQSGAPLSKLLSNYLQERLQGVFHEAMLVAPRERYAQEGITLDDGAEEDWLSETVNPGPMVDLLDKAPQNTIVRSSQADLRDCDRRGLLWLLDEESMYPGSSDDTFLERVMTHYGAPHQTHYLIKKAPHNRQFILQHLQGTNPVLYDVSGWVKASRENPVTKKTHTLLQESQNEDIGRLSSWSRGACGVGAWSAAVGDASTLRRASSIRRTLTTGDASPFCRASIIRRSLNSGTAGMKRRSTALQAKFVADGIVDTLRRCGAGGVQFVCCLVTNQLNESQDDVNIPLLRSQFRGFQLLDAARLYKQGFPEHMPLSEFARRYRLLATSESETTDTSQTTTISDRQIVDDMLLALDLDVTSYRLGLSQIMFRGGVVGELDARRDAALARVLVRLQARARGLLARRRAQRLRTQHTAARCVQRNVRAFLAVRDWPWWRLLVRVTPLLAVHRTEHRLKQAQDELETLRSKLEKVEGERTHYKNETEKLETKLSEVGGELAEERAAAALATERADAEAAERLRVERDNREFLANNQRLQQASERLELELLHWRSAENGGAEPSDSEGSEADGVSSGEKYKRRFERAHRELQLLRAQLRRQHEDDLEQLVSVKKQLEKKVQDAYEEVEEQRAVAAQWKRKLQKLTNDMADLRSLLDEQTCRNNLLEKRQRKFDAELHSAQDELKRERAAKDRLSRERDQAHAEKYALEQSLSEARMELELKEERLAAATRELEERGGGGDELATLRRAKADLERRVRDQEEELDELAGQIQLLESSKLRLEMLLEQQRKEARLEAVARDEEMEETRANASKKLKMLESQLESEHAERSLLLRERHELERRLASLEEAARAENHEQAQLVQRLKRDLKRYRALLRDAQTMLEQKEKEGGGKAQIRQLKNQLEDLELALRAANKARSAAEAEASEATAAAEEASRAKSEAAERAHAACRDAAAARAQLDDAEEEAAELLKKYRASTSALCAAQNEAREAECRAEAAAEEARQAKERLAELSARLAHAEAGHSHEHHETERRLELRNKELESSLELEATSRARLEGQLARLRDAHEQLASELAAARAKDHQAAEEVRKLTRQLRELKEENSSINAKLSEATRAKSAAESAASAAAAEAAAARDEARLAARRATALQEAIAGDLSSPGDSRDTDSENDSYSSDESIGTFLANHKLSPSAPSRNSMQLDSQKSHSPEGRQSRSSIGSGSKPLTPTKDSFA